MRHLRAAFTAFITLSPAVISALPPTSTCKQAAPWRRFTNRILSSIWRTSGHQNEEQTRIDPITGARTGRSSSLAARYGQDIVLRFNISTVEEANAIAEASEDLYLDVWEYNDNWVDIRLAKDVVSIRMHSVLYQLLKFLSRCPRFSDSSLHPSKTHMLLSCRALRLQKSSPDLFHHQITHPSLQN